MDSARFTFIKDLHHMFCAMNINFLVDQDIGNGIQVLVEFHMELILTQVVLREAYGDLTGMKNFAFFETRLITELVCLFTQSARRRNSQTGLHSAQRPVRDGSFSS